MPLAGALARPHPRKSWKLEVYNMERGGASLQYSFILCRPRRHCESGAAIFEAQVPTPLLVQTGAVLSFEPYSAVLVFKSCEWYQLAR
jgi:hypothetical protein